MTLVEFTIGFAIAIVIIVGAFFFAFRTPRLKGPTRHNIRGNGDHAGGQHHSIGESGGDGG